jgi:cobaltochelatase CobT
VEWGIQFVPAAFLLALYLALSGLLWVWKTLRRPAPVPLDPNQPYKVFCRDFDVEIGSEQLDSVLGPHVASTSDERCTEVESNLEFWHACHTSALQETALRIRAASSQELLDDTVVSFLVDHSGSLRGRPMLLAAGSAMIASDLLNSLNVKQEVLGFTTMRWRGGLSRERWLQSGRPRHPGRLNDLLHVVYCSAGERPTSLRYARMVHTDLTKENLDGEALEWAASRLRNQPESRKHLIVISDGAPVDDSTLLENGEEYLENHLRSVIFAIDKAGDIQLSAIGIKFAVDRYYARSIVIDSPDDLGAALLRLIGQVLVVDTVGAGNAASMPPKS